MNRRSFIGTASAGIILSKSILKSAETLPNEIKSEEGKEFTANPLIIPRSLKQGSKVAIIAPASPSSMGEIAHCINYLKKMKCSVEVGANIRKPNFAFRYFSASDEDRANEFMEFIQRDDIDAIIAARGGFGVMRILPLLDYKIIRDKAKPIIGFSDITALINAIYKKSNMVSFHGPVASVNFSGITSDSFTKMLFAANTFKPTKLSFKNAQAITPGKISGKLVGGNLSMICATLGTPYEIDTKDSIFFIEEVYEEPYKIDRMLTQLWLAGKLQDCNGLIIGRFKNLDTKKNFFPNYQFTIRQIIDLRIKSLGKPSLMSVPIGHDGEIITLPVGTLAEINTVDKSVTFLEASTSI